MGFEPMCAFAQTDFESYATMSVTVDFTPSPVGFVTMPGKPYVIRAFAFVDTKNTVPPEAARKFE